MPAQQPLVTPFLLVVAKFVYRLYCSGKAVPSDKVYQLCKRAVSWNAQYFAPAVEKCLDACLLLRLLSKYAVNGSKILFEAVNCARFEDDVLSMMNLHDCIIDVNDLAIQADFDMQALKKRPWIHQVFICSFDDVAHDMAQYDNKYDLIVCNNGYSASGNPAKTIENQLNILKPNGLLFFNLYLPPHVQDIMFINKLYSMACLNKKEHQRFTQIERERYFGKVRNLEQTRMILSDLDYEIIEMIPYLAGWYRKISVPIGDVRNPSP